MNETRTKNASSMIEARPDETCIVLPERFTFQSHREFRDGYFNLQPPAKTYLIDFRHTRFIDSAGLGMLLQLTEYAQSDPKRVRIVNCTKEMRETLLVAGFNEAATVIS